MFCLTEIVCLMNATADFQQGTHNVINSFFNLLMDYPAAKDTKVPNPPKLIDPVPNP